MKEFLKPSDKDAYLDFPPLNLVLKDNEKMCPVCEGHGGWNLEIFAYYKSMLRNGMEDNAENRHRNAHFRCSCSHCNGWGKVEMSEMCPGHIWEHYSKHEYFRCLNTYKCTLCGKLWEVDSSD